jgi:4-amino-4-deoxy-L-arabinose transferase-like glycosyltransferase
MNAPAAHRRLSRPEFVAMGLLLVVAAALRLWRLGALGLEVDEGIQAVTVQGWLRTGLPLFPSGIVYPRAIPFSGLQAISAWTFGLDEFALRLPSALFGVAAVVVTFMLARALFDHRVAWVAATFIALSAWEVELSRYARFYTAFQVAWGLTFLCLFRALAQGKTNYWWGFAAAALAAVTVHELSILLGACLLLPLFDRQASWRTRATAVVALMGLAVAWVAARRGLGPLFASFAPPHGLQPVTESAPVAGVFGGFPSLRVAGLGEVAELLRAEPLILAALLSVILIAAVLIVRSRGPRGWRSTVLPIVAVAFGGAHLFVAAGLALLLHVAWLGTSVRAFWSRALWPVYGALGLFLALWTVLLYPRLDFDARAIALTLFGFPNLPQHFFYWFALGWPVFLAAIVIAGIVMFDRVLRTGDRSMLYLLGGIIAPVVVASTYEAFFESRYVFHVYPLLVILFAWGLTRVAEVVSDRLGAAHRSHLVLAAVAAIGFFASFDVGARTWDPLVRTYASPRDPMRSVISWSAFAGFHQDHEGPSRFVNEHVTDGDRVAVIATLHQLPIYSFYLGRIDVVLGKPEEMGHYRLKNGRLVERATGSAVVLDPAQLTQPDGSGATWLVGDDVLLSDGVENFSLQVRRESRALAGETMHRGRDGVTFVRRLP